MPEHQLPVAVALLVLATGSLIALALNRPKEGKIQLFDRDDGNLLHDPFDVTTPQEIAEGQPLGAAAFWRRIRFVKLALVLNFAAIFAIQVVCLGWSAVASDSNNKAISILHTLFALYALALSIWSFCQDGEKRHFESIVHLGVLSFFASFLLGAIGIMPTDKPLSTSSDTIPAGLWYTVLVLYLVAFVVTINIPRGPPLHFPPALIYSDKIISTATNSYEDNVAGTVRASIFNTFLFSHVTKVLMMGDASESIEIADLPILSAEMRATYIFSRMRHAMHTIKLRIGNWTAKPGSGWDLMWRIVRINALMINLQICLTAVCAVLSFAPAFFFRNLVSYLESDPERINRRWGFFFCAGLGLSPMIKELLTNQIWSILTVELGVKLRIQLNSILYAKTLVCKDVASSTGSSDDEDKSPKATTVDSEGSTPDEEFKKEDEDDFTSKAQVLTLMTTDVDHVSEFSWHLFSLVDPPVEIVVGGIFLYDLLGVSCFWGLAVMCLFIPMNHFASSVVIGAQRGLMKARDERISLMNEILGGIRMLKFMAWERSFESKVQKIRTRELRYQKLNYTIEVLWNAIWNASPVFVTLVAFWHFTVVRGQTLTPSIAFTSISVFDEMRFALSSLPGTFINMLQSFVSVRRIEKYLNSAEVASVSRSDEQDSTIAMKSATTTWPQGGSKSTGTPKNEFALLDVSLVFPAGELSLICGKLGSGKTLLLLSLLGEVDILAGEVLCPRSPPDAVASFHAVIPPPNKWVVPNICAYVPQSAWLQNASIKENILFSLPYVEERYQMTLEVCALVSDLKILEDGDESEVGERGITLSGGQKARVSLARAVYSRASVLLLDDVLSAVDAHTAHHIYNNCLTGEIMHGRTVILVSHHVQLCAPGAEYIVALDNGRVQFEGARDAFYSSGVLKQLLQSEASDVQKETEDSRVPTAEEIADAQPSASAEKAPDPTATTEPDASKADKRPPRKLIDEEKRAVGRVDRQVWYTYLVAFGRYWYWALFITIMVLAILSPLGEKGWITYWAGEPLRGGEPRSPLWYMKIYAAVCTAGIVFSILRWFVLFDGAIRGSATLHKRLLESVLFTNIRFHDTISRGRLLNRFGKDLESIDSSLCKTFGDSVMYGLSAFTTLVTLSVVGGWIFVVAALAIGVLFYQVGRSYGQTSRDMRRLDAVTRSPLYSIYGETIAGAVVLRAFGASSKFLRDMLRCVDTNANPQYWLWAVVRWSSTRFSVLSAMIFGVVGFISVLTHVDASLAGFALVFASTMENDIIMLIRGVFSLEQSLVAVERVKEFSELDREPPEHVEPRPDPSWPSAGHVKCENLVIRYAPELPDVLHDISFEISAGQKIGVLGRTGSGKSTLALSFFRFVEATKGRIIVDGIDISTVGLSDLRGRLTIIPQDPTIISGTLRSALDVFREYADIEIFEALRRVHLIRSEEISEETETANLNAFKNLDSPVSEGGSNLSTGEKQLLCMARAILKRSKVLIMDEATASVDYATDELISKTIRHEFAESTIITIAHRLRSIIDYDKVMLLEDGKIVEFDKPGILLNNRGSKFHALCEATGHAEFLLLKRLAGLGDRE